MKKIFLILLALITVSVTACSSFSLSTQASLTQTSNGLSDITQLALGSLKLEDTEYAITTKQASDLLTMWQVYDELTNSDTAAQEEIDALVSQIQETMTNEQMQAISDMQLTQQDVFTAMQGVTVTSNTSSSTASVSVPSNSGSMPAGGPPDGGGGAPPDMGGGMPSDFGSGGAPSDTGAGQTQNAQTGSGQAGTVSVPPALVQALIEILQQKVAA